MKKTKDMNKNKKIMLIMYVVFLFICSGSFLLMPVASVMKEISRIPLFISGGCFWSGTIGVIFSALKINSSRKKSCKTKSKKKQTDQKQLGLISFFKNKEAKVADIAMIMFAIAFIITKITIDNIYCLYAFLALFIFSFGMHCMLNGKNYIYLKSKVKEGDKS